MITELHRMDLALTAEKQDAVDTMLRPGFGTNAGGRFVRLTGLSRATFSRWRRLSSKQGGRRA